MADISKEEKPKNEMVAPAINTKTNDPSKPQLVNFKGYGENFSILTRIRDGAQKAISAVEKANAFGDSLGNLSPEKQKKIKGFHKPLGFISALV